MDPSEWGQLNAGQRYNVLALDLDRAIGLADLRRYELALLERAREIGWHGAVRFKSRDHWPDARPAILNLHALERETGVLRGRWREARNRLLASRIFLPGPGRSVWINKDADQWIEPDSGRPRLTPQMLAYCSDARPRRQAELPIGQESEEGATTLPKGGATAPPKGGRNGAL